MFMDGSLDGWTGLEGTVPGLDSAAASRKCAWIIGGSLYTIHECVAPACSYIGPDATPAEMEGGVCVNQG